MDEGAPSLVSVPRSPKKVVVIGAGMSGLICAKSLLDENILPIVFEKTDHIGGLWCFNPDPSIHSCYKGLHTNTFRDATNFRDLHMPKDYPDYLTHEQMLAYFHDFSSKFSLGSYIRFNSEVSKIEIIREDNEEIDEWDLNVKWKVSVLTNDKIEELIVDGVAICNGHHWDELWPKESDINGLKSFTGQTLHSHQYRSPEDFLGKRVIVSGIGISGRDIIRELTELDIFVVSSSRRIQPKKKEKLLVDQISDFISQEDALNEPMKPDILSISGSTVTFQDNSVFSNVDAIIWCWGYNYNFPFLNSFPIYKTPSRVPLYKYLFDPELSNLAFIGLPTVDGSLHPIAERQSIWFSKILSKQTKLPTKSEMKKSILEWENSLKKYNVKYRPMQVSLKTYLIEESGEDPMRFF